VSLFDPFNLGRVTEEYCIDAVANIYKEQRFTAASLNDFSELHQSVRYMIEIFYWLIMVFILQYAFGINVTDYILPFVALLLAFSFAISSLVGNIFLAFAYVFFMAPYDVGEFVQIGLWSSNTAPIVGTVKNITLLYTIITTTKNETVRLNPHDCYPIILNVGRFDGGFICRFCCSRHCASTQSKVPNHTLFFEKIYNLTETTGAVQSFVIAFNMFGMENTRMVSVSFTAARCAVTLLTAAVLYAGRH
jgi:small-conductance mechanosensitive channel